MQPTLHQSSAAGQGLETSVVGQLKNGEVVAMGCGQLVGQKLHRLDFNKGTYGIIVGFNFSFVNIFQKTSKTGGQRAAKSIIRGGV